MKMADNTVESAINYFKNELKEYFGTEELNQTLYLVFSFYFDLDRAQLSLNQDKSLTESDLLKVIHTVKRLKNSEPLTYILGECEFYGLNFKVEPTVLIPRPETEELVDFILKEQHAKTNLKVLDIGTGSGCIAISLKKHFLTCQVEGLDKSESALNIANQNAKSNNVDVLFFQKDILDKDNWEGIKKYDVIVSNPPYITLNEKGLMSSNVLDYEPHMALFVNNETPLLFYNAIADFSLMHLENNGKLYFEINEQFGNEVMSLLEGKNFKNITLIQDLNQKDRIVCAELIN